MGTDVRTEISLELLRCELPELTYARVNIDDWLLDDNIPAAGRVPISNRTFSTPRADLGSLDIVPLEILQQILVQLDLDTLTAFQRANRRARLLIHSLPKYKAILEHAPNALCGIALIKTGRWITCETLYEKLYTANCATCGDFGGYLYLIVCERTCFVCLSENPRFLPLRYSHAAAKFGLARSILKALPQLRSLAGRYTPGAIKVRERLSLIDATSIQDAAAAGATAMDVHQQSEITSPSTTRSMTRRSHDNSQQASISSQSRGVRRINWFDGKSSNTLRFMGVVSCPWLDNTSNSLEWGFHCGGCEDEGEWPRDFRRKFTVESFAAHLETEGMIKEGVHSVVY